MTKRNGIRYSEEQKASIVKRMMPPYNETVAKIAKEEGISDVTLYKWRKEARTVGEATPGNGKTSDKWSSQDKFLIVMETFSMNEVELAEYCRKKGLYRAQIEEWKRVCLQANGQLVDQDKQLNGVLKELPPTQIIPKLADEGTYLASESTFYRLLREEKMQYHRGRSQKPTRKTPESHLATKPNQVWTWDITWLGEPVKGLYYRLYLILDLFSRKVVGWEVWETEEARQ